MVMENEPRLRNIVLQHRGGKGIKTCNITEKNGQLVSMEVVTGEEDLMLITTGGVLIRMAVGDISTMGRNTQGVKLIRLDEGDEEYVATVAKVEKEEEIPEEEVEGEPGEGSGQDSEGNVEEDFEGETEQVSVEEPEQESTGDGNPDGEQTNEE